jgi:hypothetical protein
LVLFNLFGLLPTCHGSGMVLATVSGLSGTAPNPKRLIRRAGPPRATWHLSGGLSAAQHDGLNGLD